MFHRADLTVRLLDARVSELLSEDTLDVEETELTLPQVEPDEWIRFVHARQPPTAISEKVHLP
jgi:hypothetical protein